MAVTALQLRFLSARLLTANDKEAAEQIGIPPQTVYNWKQETEFLQRYEAVFEDGIQLAQEYTRKLLGKAAMRLDEALDAVKTVSLAVPDAEDKTYVSITEPDHKSRLEAVKLLFQSHGLLKDKIDIEIRIRQIAESMGLDAHAAIEEAKRITSSGVTR